LNSTSAEYCSALVESNHQRLCPRERAQSFLRTANVSITDQNKRRAAQAALSYVSDATCVGVGTGSTVNFFIAALATERCRIKSAVSSSNATTLLLREAGIDVIDLNDAGPIDVYVDGADEATRRRELIKGGGGALTREKIVAAAARRFVCIVDAGKLVDALGKFPLPVEVIPMARTYVARELASLGGRPVLRNNYVTDNGNVILDVHGLAIDTPAALERRINEVAGVVTVGLFAIRPADILLVGTSRGVDIL
jgi:ribose 5-phosphate isomerase A